MINYHTIISGICIKDSDILSVGVQQHWSCGGERKEAKLKNVGCQYWIELSRNKYVKIKIREKPIFKLSLP